MKTAKGYTKETEAIALGKYVVGYCENPSGQCYFVPFNNRAKAERFADEHGANDPLFSPRKAWIVGDNDYQDMTL